MGVVLWLDRPPLIRWTAAALLVAVAAWGEFSPAPTEDHAFLSVDVPAGSVLTADHVEYRRLPLGTVSTVDPNGVAATDLRAGDPLVASMITDFAVPPGWVVIDAPVPSHAAPGMDATVVIVDEGTPPIEFGAVVAHRADPDPFGSGGGALALPPEWTATAAAAVASGNLIVGITPVGR